MLRSFPQALRLLKRLGFEKGDAYFFKQMGKGMLCTYALFGAAWFWNETSPLGWWTLKPRPKLFFTIVQNGHWAVVVANIMQKQFNVFDSNSEDLDYANTLEKPICNLITNFKTLVKESNPWKLDFDTFERFSPPGYPRQSTTFDCGIFSILYLENLTTKGMKQFKTDTNSLLNFPKYVAAKLFKHPQNTLNSEEEFRALLRNS